MVHDIHLEFWEVTLIVLALGIVSVLLAVVLKPSSPDKLAAIKAMYDDYVKAFPDVEEMSVTELQQHPQDNLVLVDVRESREMEVSMLPGAISCDAFERDRDRYKNHTIVLYCTIGYRSGLYAKTLQSKGFNQVFNLAGSILSWTHVGGSLVDETGETTHRVHVYGEQWDLIADGYESVW